MTELQITDKLGDCFSVVFPELQTEQLRNAERGSIADWDSLASITLLCVVNEQFEIDLGMELLEQLNSFPAYESRVRSALEGRA